eukprot:CAMPEP_0174830674 /NCGR_PEP_ID=MMETSP1114-20130205/2655_1 /TAXON_ID=312471 /ORGANISM="Neobodo designis, Strain CCAP 1951/1" /LENGTH=373 /DNA_ID=CAMNT_0016064477 /DNA_START=63 /DNA_END=1181 /DNA_ORIENTATION=+
MQADAVNDLRTRGFVVVPVSEELAAAVLAAHAAALNFYDDTVTPPAIRDLVRIGSVADVPDAGLVTSCRWQHAVVKTEEMEPGAPFAVYAQWSQAVSSFQVANAASANDGAAFPWPVHPPNFASAVSTYTRAMATFTRAVATQLFGAKGVRGSEGDTDMCFVRAVPAAVVDVSVALSNAEATQLRDAPTAHSGDDKQPLGPGSARVFELVREAEHQGRRLESSSERVASHTDSGVLTVIPVVRRSGEPCNLRGLEVRDPRDGSWARAVDDGVEATPPSNGLHVSLFVMLGEEGAAIADALWSRGGEGESSDDGRRHHSAPPATVHRVVPDDRRTAAMCLEHWRSTTMDPGRAPSAASALRVTLPFQLRGWRPA